MNVGGNMGANATASIRQKPAVRFIKDVGLVVSLPFRRGAEKTEPLATIATDVETLGKNEIRKSGGAIILSDACFSVVQKARLKIAEIYASQGKYDLAIGQCITICKLAGTFKKSDTLPQAMRNYYKGKAAENSNKPDNAAACMRASCDLFLKIGKIDAALAIGEKAATLYQKEGNFTAALILCDELAAIAKDRYNFYFAERFYNMAANNTENRELAVSYRSLADECVQRAAKNAEAEAFARISTGPAI